MTLTLSDVRERLRADDEQKWDMLAERHRIRIHGGRLFFAQISLQNYPRGLEMAPWATGQLCQKLNIPTAYCGSWGRKRRRRNGCCE
jgi:hypothetical protein